MKRIDDGLSELMDNNDGYKDILQGLRQSKKVESNLKAIHEKVNELVKGKPLLWINSKE